MRIARLVLSAALAAAAAGTVAMPPNPQAPDGELEQIIGYILSLK
jgi:cytochrome c551/c552